MSFLQNRPFTIFFILSSSVFIFLESSTLAGLYCAGGLVLANWFRSRFVEFKSDNYFYFFSPASEMEPHFAFGDMEYVPSESQRKQAAQLVKEKQGWAKLVTFAIIFLAIYYLFLPSRLGAMVNLSQYRFLYVVVATTVVMGSHFLHLFASLAILFIPVLFRLETPESPFYGLMWGGPFFSAFLLFLSSYSFFNLNIGLKNYLKRVGPQMALFGICFFLFYQVLLTEPLFSKKSLKEPPQNKTKTANNDFSFRKAQNQQSQNKMQGRGQSKTDQKGDKGNSGKTPKDLIESMEKGLSQQTKKELKKTLEQIKKRKGRAKLPKLDIDKMKNQGFSDEDIERLKKNMAKVEREKITEGDLDQLKKELEKMVAKPKEKSAMKSDIETYLNQRQQKIQEAGGNGDPATLIDRLLQWIQKALWLLLFGIVSYFLYRVYQWLENRKRLRGEQEHPEELRQSFLARLKDIQSHNINGRKEVTESYLLLDEIMKIKGYPNKGHKAPLNFMVEFGSENPYFAHPYRLISEKFVDVHFGKRNITQEELAEFRQASREMVEGLLRDQSA